MRAVRGVRSRAAANMRATARGMTHFEACQGMWSGPRMCGLVRVYCATWTHDAGRAEGGVVSGHLSFRLTPAAPGNEMCVSAHPPYFALHNKTNLSDTNKDLHALEH
eukprot:6111903-Prymnesium_polylepis.1